MNRNEFCRTHWDYFLVLESDALNIERYVSFNLGDDVLYDGRAVSDTGNGRCFSNEFVKQYQTICSEVDVVLKTICREINSQSTASNMANYTDEVLNQPVWCDLPKQEVGIQKSGIVLKPFLNWRTSPNYNAPDWFPLYNKVKHDRSKSYMFANLKNTLNALAGLYLLEIFLVKHIADRDNAIAKSNHTWTAENDIPDVPDDISRLFHPNNFQTKHTVIGRNSYFSTDESVDAMLDSIFNVQA